MLTLYQKCIHIWWFVLDVDKDRVDGVQFWCQKCSEMRCKECPSHGKPSIVRDQPILSRAMASLPSGLSVNKVGDKG